MKSNLHGQTSVRKFDWSDGLIDDRESNGEPWKSQPDISVLKSEMAINKRKVKR